MGEEKKIERGMAVITADGQGLGQVKSAGDPTPFLHVDCRMAPDLYIPMDAVRTVEDGTVRLRATKQQAMNMGWEAKPRHE